VHIYCTITGTRYVRTPDAHLANLPGYPFAHHYVTVEGLRMHYVDEGPLHGDIVLLLHSEPTWSYLYRTVIPPIAAAGYRVIAADYIGMGCSDKPVDLGYHTFEQHVRNLKTFISALGLEDITLFCQGWGSAIGLRVAGDLSDLFARIVVANGTLPMYPKGCNPLRIPTPVRINCALGDFSQPTGLTPTTRQPFLQRWIVYALTAPRFTPSQVIAALVTRPLSIEEKAAYDAPYPSFIYRAAVRAFPSMLAAIEEQNAPAWYALGEFQRPFLFLAGEQDHFVGSVENQQHWIDHVPGAQGQPHQRYPEAGHFIQEDVGPILATNVLRFLAANPIHALAPGAADHLAERPQGRH
jgi:pimeloyl-ACP methyl ester carboxylesterase